MGTDTGYRPYDYIRICDVCLHRYHFSALKPIGELRWACPDDYPGLTANQISRFNARARPLKVRPNKWAKPVSQIPTYQRAEGETFNLIAAAAPADSIGAGSQPTSAAWAAIYMADVVIQGLRPAIWIASAKTTLRACLAYLLTKQHGSPTGFAGTPDNSRYGGILSGLNYDTNLTWTAGVAFLKGFQALGDYNYLLAADRCATFVRHVQSGDLQVTQGTVFPAGGAPYHVGGLASGVVAATGLLAQTYNTQDIGALWFLALLVAARSPSTSYGDGAATSFFSAATAAPLSQMIAELEAFATAGAKTSAGLVSGLSTTQVGTVYTAALASVGGSASWTFPSTFAPETVVQPIRGLYEAGGLTDQVTGLVSWLTSFSANPANATPVQPDSVTVQGNTGVFDAALCPATSMTASAPFMEAAGAQYAWYALGVLSPILAQLSPGLRTAKDTLLMPRRYSAANVDLRYIGPQGVSGLSFQPNGTQSVIQAAKAGMIFRQPPGMYPRVALY